MKPVSWIHFVLLAVLGAPCAGHAAEPFSIVIIPDTQKYTIGGRHGDVFRGQTEWIRQNAEKLNLKFVIHEGDVVETPTDESQWKLADEAFHSLDEGKLPYTISVGNHDMDVAKRDKTLFNRYFPPGRFESHEGYGGHMTASPDNRFHYLEAGGMNFLVLSLEYSPPADALKWANALVARHPMHRVLVNTHSYLNVNEFSREGKPIWEEFVRKHPNIFLVVSGHLSVGRRTDTGDNGNKVFQLLANYQGHRRGGNGWLRILRFIPDEDRIEVSTYSTFLNRYMGRGDPKWSRLEDNFFDLRYDMSDPAEAGIAAEDFATISGKRSKDPELAYDPVELYGEDNINGWPVYVHQDLEFDHPNLHAETIALLSEKLGEIEKILPEEAVKSLRAIPIWIELNHPKHPCACFHPDDDWLKENGMNPAKQGAVEISNPKNFIEWSKTQPSMVLHELAHGYHFRFLRKDHAGIEAAFQRAAASGIYEQVKKRDGQEVRHYALTDRYEYFAEATESYFGENDFFPYIRAELRAFDPDAYTMVADVWGIKKTAPKIELEGEVKKIWGSAPHNAFTDLVRWKDAFYCAFREGQGHAGDLGKLRVIRSPHGDTWDSCGLIERENFDLRDAALSVTPDDRLMLLGGSQRTTDEGASTGTVVCFSEDGSMWSEPVEATASGRWLWRVTWHQGKAYGVTYATPSGKPWTSLLASSDGVRYEVVQPQLLGDGWTTEARLRFAPDGTAFCLHRRDGEANSAFLGRSTPPFRDWEWKDLGRYFGGPNFLQIPGGIWIGAGRTLEEGASTQLTFIDTDQLAMAPILKLPSGGDTSYPGMVWHGDKLWVSYYSSHDGKTSIYLAKVKVAP
jgi:hypothetical protein